MSNHSEAGPSSVRRILIAVCSQAFLGELAGRKVSGHTRRAYRHNLDQLETFLMEKHPEVIYLDQIEAVHVLEFMEELYNVNLSAASRARVLSAVRACFDYAGRKGFVTQSVATEVPLPTLGQHLPILPPHQDLMRLLESDCNGAWPSRDATIKDLLLLCGPSELVSLNVKDIDLKAMRVFFPCREDDQPKPIGDYLFDELNAYMPERLARICARGVEHPESIEPLFINRDLRGIWNPLTRARLTTRSVQRIIERMTSSTGIKNCTPKTLRFSHGVHMLSSGADFNMTRELLGKRGLSSVKRMHNMANDKRGMLERTHPMARGALAGGERLAD